MEFKVKRVFPIKTPREMYDLLMALYTHSEYRTQYELIYRDKLNEIRNDFKEIGIDYEVMENVDFVNGCKFELSLSAYVKDKSFNTSEVCDRMDLVMDDVVDYIILKTNLEPCPH